MADSTCLVEAIAQGPTWTRPFVKGTAYDLDAEIEGGVLVRDVVNLDWFAIEPPLPEPAVTEVAGVAVTVQTTPTLLAEATDRRLDLGVSNLSTQVVYLGGSTVSTSQGTPVPPGGVASLTMNAHQRIYAVVAAETAEVRVLGV